VDEAQQLRRGWGVEKGVFLPCRRHGVWAIRRYESIGIGVDMAPGNCHELDDPREEQE
jgi:hypothetical protein